VLEVLRSAGRGVLCFLFKRFQVGAFSVLSGGVVFFVFATPILEFSPCRFLLIFADFCRFVAYFCRFLQISTVSSVLEAKKGKKKIVLKRAPICADLRSWAYSCRCAQLGILGGRVSAKAG
jgi:hypothetical protein